MLDAPEALAQYFAPGPGRSYTTLPTDIAGRRPLGQAWRRLDHALDDFIADELIAA
jgi:hypothetical protein